MDDDSLDEFEDRSPGPDVHPQLGDAEESSDGDSGGSEEDAGSELSDSSDGEDEEGDLEDGSGSEGSEDDEDVGLMAGAMADVMADAQGSLEAGGALPSDDDSESCPICLNAFRGQVVGTPQSCAHYFCLDCILEWSKNANSCPVDRTAFKCICIRACYGGEVLRKIPVQSARAAGDGDEDGDEDEDPTFCEVCGCSDREDRLLLCDGCDAGYHMECLEPPLREVPVDEWFCPECASSEAAAAATDAGLVSEDEVSLLLADAAPTASRLRPLAGRTRAIARTRQSERVRATVNRNRMSTASRIQRIPRHLMSSLLDETIEAVVSGLSTAVYQRPTTPRAPARRRRKGRRRRKAQRRPSLRTKGSAARSRRRQGRAKKRKGRTPKDEVTARRRIAQTLGLREPVRGACIPSVHRPADPSLGLLRADIGAASLSLFGDPYELDPFDSSEEPAANPASPLSAKRRVLSRSALRSHQPVARPVPVGLSRRTVPAVAPEPEMDAAPGPDLLGSILSGQSFLLMDSADVTIHRDGSLSAKRAAPVSFQRISAGPCAGGEGPGPSDGLRPRAPPSGHSGSLGACCQGGPAPSGAPALSGGAAVRPDSSVAPWSSQAQNASRVSSPGSKRHDSRQVNGDSKQALPLRFAPKTSNGDLPSKGAVLGQAARPAPRRSDVSELPRIPKIRRDDGGSRREGPAPAPAGGQRVSIPSACISRLTGREGPGQPGLGTRADGEPRGRASREPGVHAGGGAQPPGPPGPSRAKGSGTSFQSFRINIPGSAAHASRLPPPGFCDTFRPVDSKTPRKDSASSLFPLRKAKQLESEIYDPFDPTGSDSSAASSPERLGSGLLPSEIRRTISVDSPRAAPLLAVRRVTSYTVEAGASEEPGPPHGPALDVLRLPDEEGPPEGRGPAAARAQRPSPPGPWEEEDPPLHSSFFGAEERTVTCVMRTEPEVPPPAPPAHRVVEVRAQPRPRSRSTSSSRGRKEARSKRAPAREPGRTRSGSRSGSRSRDGSSGSVSPPAAEDDARRQQPKARSRRSSSECSSSHERARRKRAKDKGRERGRGVRGPGRRPSRSRSGSPGSSSHEHRDSRRRRRRRSGSRPRGRGCSPPSSLDRAWRPRHPRERSRERPRDRRGSRERRKHRSRSPRSPSAERRPREHRQPRSRETRPRPRSPERRPPVKGASPAPPAPEEPRPHSESPARPLALAGAGALAEEAGAEALPRASAVPEVPAGCPPEDLDYGDSVEAGHVFEDFSGEGIFMQLDDMSSPPSPESTDSSPEHALPPAPAGPAAPAACRHPDAGLAMAVIRREVSLMHSEDAGQPVPWAEGPQEPLLFQRDSARAAVAPGTLGSLAVGQEEGPPQAAVLRAKAPVKRVTWNLQEAAGGALAEDRGQRTPLHRPQQPQGEAGQTEDKGPAAAPQQAPLPEPPPHGPLLPEPGFPDADAMQAYGPSLPPAAALPASIPPCAPVSQPAVQFTLQASAPLAGCGVARSPAPVPAVPTPASEPAGHASATNNSEERTATPRPAAEKTKNEEYMKKLHVQERAVEEVKLAIKPFYQRREVTKDEYKDILRKAVQKICHSRSGEINPLKVGNLVKAYVDKYRHMRRHRRPEAGEEPPAPGAEG